MPPPQFIPDRRIPLTSTASSHNGHEAPPGRPISPPPPDLIQRATTPQLRPAFSPRMHGSSLPPSQNLGQRPSTTSFRSAANGTGSYTGPSAALAHLAHRDRARELSSTSLQSGDSLGSGRSSMSSDHHYYPHAAGSRSIAPTTTTNGPHTPGNQGAGSPAGGAGGMGGVTDPSVIHAITQTMIGEFLYKYTRKAIGKGYGEKRHKRFFWVHPYTKTLYWSSSDPGSSNVFESSAKSAYIEAVRSVLDPNPMPPGLYQYSVVVSTPQREMKITAPTKERHDMWLSALKYLLTRPSTLPATSPGVKGIPGPMPSSPLSNQSHLQDQDHDDDAPPPQSHLLASPQSFRSVRSTGTNEWNATPRGQRSQSQLSLGGSVGKRSGTPAAEYLRYGGGDSYTPSPGKEFVDIPGQQDDDDLDFELHDDTIGDAGFQGLENVRACCDGRHTVGPSGHIHHHHHHNHNQPPTSPPPPPRKRERSRTRDHHLDAHPSDVERPTSPAWSFRSRAGSATSGEGGGGLFSGKLRFGSKRATKTPKPPVPTFAGPEAP